ncbi:hypothetical protein JCM8115_001953 [Rhodotorula mucilaginosa]
MASRVSPLFLLGLLFACSRLFFAAASPVRPLSDWGTDESAEVTNSSSSHSLWRREVAVPRYQRCKQKKRFAMTFDDGPLFGGPTATLLEQYGGKGTYFVNGYNSVCIYDQSVVDDLIRRYKAGHVIGSHSWNHDDITKLSPEELHYQLDLLETALWKILGIKPRFFRPPFGEYDNKSLKVLQERGYSVALWDFDSEDANGATPEESIESYKDMLRTFPTPHIALNHEIEAGTVWNVVPTVVPLIHDAGYKLVDLGQCLGMEPYQAVGKRGRRDSTWTCDGTPGPWQA